MPQNIALIIPAYQPSERLLRLVRDLKNAHDGPIVVIDDGSTDDHRWVFEALREIEVEVLRNATNLGKGGAIKHGINYALVHHADIAGIVTADADGQHSPNDICSIASALASNPDQFVLGARAFGLGTPWRSALGNAISRWLYRGLLGITLKDTQTGLRGLPRQLTLSSLSIRSNRYEFETEMLTVARSLRIPFLEIPIETIYEDNNAGSHFNPFFDSVRIYFVVLRYGLSSLATALVDLISFAVLTAYVPNVILANLLSRSVALFVQFALLRSFVFKVRADAWRFLAFVAYVAVIGVASGAMQDVLNATTGLDALPAKVLVETAIFVFNFLFLRDILFRS